MQVFVTSDLHFGHGGIIKYCNRPFKSVSEMDHVLTDNWNKVVGRDDIVYVLGDFARDHTREYLSRLKGIKRLVIGNHDTKPVGYYLDCGFEQVFCNPVLIDDWLFSHEPVKLDTGEILNLFGHVHDSELYKTVSEKGFCCCVERTDYFPIPFEKVKQMSAQYAMSLRRVAPHPGTCYPTSRENDSNEPEVNIGKPSVEAEGKTAGTPEKGARGKRVRRYSSEKRGTRSARRRHEGDAGGDACME